MRQKKLDCYRDQLLEMRERLRTEMEGSLDALLEDLQVPGSIVPEPSEGLDRELVVEATQAGIHDLVNAALERIEQGTYGRCIDCGTEIPEARLDAIPYTPYCVACELKHETEGE